MLLHAIDSRLCTFDLVIEEVDPPILIHRFCGWLLDIMIERREKQRCTNRTICVQGFGKVRGNCSRKRPMRRVSSPVNRSFVLSAL